MTVYHRIQTMTKDELQKFIYYIYLCGHLNEQCAVDDEVYYKHMLDCPSTDIDSLVTWFETLQPVKLHFTPNNGGSSYFIDTKFYSTEDAVSYIYKHHRFVTKVADDKYPKYATCMGRYSIMPCEGWSINHG